MFLVDFSNHGFNLNHAELVLQVPHELLEAFVVTLRVVPGIGKSKRWWHSNISFGSNVAQLAQISIQEVNGGSNRYITEAVRTHTDALVAIGCSTK